MNNREAETPRVLRGGSWLLDRIFAWSAYRVRLNPNSRNDFVGFRTCAIIEPTPQELADEFVNMGEEDQVQFLNTVADASRKYGFLWCFQFAAIANSKNLTPEARAWMRELGEYSEPTT